MTSKNKIILIIGLLLILIIYTFHSYSRNYLHKHPITIVTSYFPFDKSKHSKLEYYAWMKNFLSKVKTPMVIYTEKSLVPLISKFRNGAPTDFQVYKNVWQLPPMAKLHEVYKEQNEIDPENFQHSPELYAIWNSKPWMVSNTAIELNPFNSIYFFWVDIGCFRESNHNFKNWPDLDRVRDVFEANDLTDHTPPHFFSIFKFDLEAGTNFGAVSNVDFMIGTFFGGSVSSVKWWSETFYKVHDLMLSKKYFIGKDQNIMNWIAVNYSSDLLVTCGCEKDPFHICGDEWFYFQNWYASAAERMPTCDVTIQVQNMTQFLRVNN